MISFFCCYCLKSWKYFGPKYYLEIWLTWLSLQWVGNAAQRVTEELTPWLIKDFVFWCGPLLKSLLNLLQCCSCFMFWIFGLWGRWDLSTLTRDLTLTPCVGRQSPNHWTTREVLLLALVIFTNTLTSINPVAIRTYELRSFVLRFVGRGNVTHSSILTWRIPWPEEAGGLQSMRLQRVGHHWATNARTHTHTHTHSEVCICDDFHANRSQLWGREWDSSLKVSYSKSKNW